jgi:hypothetical protein
LSLYRGASNKRADKPLEVRPQRIERCDTKRTIMMHNKQQNKARQKILAKCQLSKHLTEHCSRLLIGYENLVGSMPVNSIEQ